MLTTTINAPFVPARYLRRLVASKTPLLIDGNEVSAVIAYNILNGQDDIPQDIDFYIINTGECIKVDAPCMVELGNKRAYYDPSKLESYDLINFINTASAVKVKPV